MSIFCDKTPNSRSTKTFHKCTFYVRTVGRYLKGENSSVLEVKFVSVGN